MGGVVTVVALVFIAWSIIGSILYSDAMVSHQCSNVLISWIVYKLMTYILVAPVLFSASYRIKTAWCKVSFTTLITIIVFGIWCGTDIAGLIVVTCTGNEFDTSLSDGSQSVSFGIDTFLLYGCSIHLGSEVVLICTLWWMSELEHEEVGWVYNRNKECINRWVLRLCVPKTLC
eukprot:262192_1